MNIRLKRILFTPKDAASVVVFRIGFGLLMFADAIYHLIFLPLDTMYVTPAFLFRYYGFEWVPIIGEYIYALYVVIAVASVGIAVGFLYRICAVIVAVGTAWVFFQDQAQYLNHMYMLILYSGLMVFIPANRYWSLDARRKPEIRSDTLPAWCRLILILQIEVILIYAGIVKLNADWLALEPLGTWLSAGADLPFFGYFFVQEWSVALGAYGVIGLHLIGAPLLMIRKTRLYVLAIYACFHLLNHFVFNIGVFPWVTLFASLVCFNPDWPREFFARVRRKVYAPPEAENYVVSSQQWQTVVATLFGVWLAYQVFMPARNVFYEGNVAWNENGHRFSWRMKLRDHRGRIRFAIVDPGTNERTLLDISGAMLSARQQEIMSCKPDMILQFSHYLRDEVATKLLNVQKPEIYAKALCSLNFRREADLIDSEVNLAAESRHLGNNRWILPLNVPLADRIGGRIPPSVKSEM